MGLGITAGTIKKHGHPTILVCQGRSCRAPVFRFSAATVCRLPNSSTGRFDQPIQFTSVQPDQLALLAGVDDRVARARVGIGFHHGITHGAGPVYPQLVGIHWRWNRSCADIVGSQMHDHHSKNALLEQHPATSIAASELRFFNRANS